MRYKFTFHAQQRMRQRNVTEDDVRAALNNVTITRPSHDGNPWVHGMTSDHRTLKVCVEGEFSPEAATLKIITVAWSDDDD